MFTRIKKVLPVFAVPGRLLYNAGTALFGMAKNTLPYINHDKNKEAYYLHPASIASVVTSLIVNSVTRIPAFFREEDNGSQTNTTTSDVSEANTEQAAVPEETQDPVIEVNADSPPEIEIGYAARFCVVVVPILCKFSNTFTGLGSMLSAYNSGKVLCEFIGAVFISDVATELTEKEDEDWIYYTIHGVALYLSVTNLYAFTTYVSVSVNKNCDTFVKSVTQNTFLNVNKKMATTAVVVASLNMISSSAFTFMSTRSGMQGLNKDLEKFPSIEFRIPDWVIMVMGSTIGVSSLITSTMTFIPELYINLQSAYDNKDAESSSASNENGDQNPAQPKSIEPKWKKGLRGSLYTVGVVDAANNGLQGATSIPNAMHELFNVDPYGYVTSFGLLCGTSASICYFSFYAKKGTDNLMNDIQKHLDKAEPKNEATPLHQQAGEDGQLNVQEETQNREVVITLS